MRPLLLDQSGVGTPGSFDKILAFLADLKDPVITKVKPEIELLVLGQWKYIRQAHAPQGTTIVYTGIGVPFRFNKPDPLAHDRIGQIEGGEVVILKPDEVENQPMQVGERGSGGHLDHSQERYIQANTRHTLDRQSVDRTQAIDHDRAFEFHYRRCSAENDQSLRLLLKFRLVGVARMDAALERLLQAGLLPAPGRTDTFFQPDRPLRSFGARITLAARLGLIETPVEQALKTLRRVRNSFAHSTTTATLTDPGHADRLLQSYAAARANSLWQPLERILQEQGGADGTPLDPAMRDTILLIMILVAFLEAAAQQLCPQPGKEAQAATLPYRLMSLQIGKINSCEWRGCLKIKMRQVPNQISMATEIKKIDRRTGEQVKGSNLAQDCLHAETTP